MGKRSAITNIVLIFVFLAAMLLPVAGNAASPPAGDPSAADGLITFKQAPFTLDGLTYVPVRELAAHVGLNIAWDGELNRLVVDNGHFAIAFETLANQPGWGSFTPLPRAGSHPSVGAKSAGGTWPYRLENGSIFLPLRPMADIFDWKINWQPERQVVSLVVRQQGKGNASSVHFKVEKPFSRCLWPPPQRIAYLTFDDGPGEVVTPLILDILAQENIKATFFVVGERVAKYPGILRRIHAEGHAVGNHTYTHRDEVLHSGVSPFMEEIRSTEALIHSITGERPKVARMPYGTGFPAWPEYNRALQRSGYRHIGWNVNSFDANGKNVPAEHILNAVQQQIPGKDTVVILFHDLGTRGTVEALPAVIRILQGQGYFFRKLN